MKYSIVYQDREEVAELHTEIEAETARDALDQVDCQGVDASWQYQEDANGSASYVDPECPDRCYRAVPQAYECAYCGAEVPIEDAAALPAADDATEWDRLSLHHYDQCEWIKTRGSQATV
jgi:hypothetical protein